MKYWSVPREWETETAFIVAGGPSVLDVDLGLLRGRRVIVINSSVHAVPWADFLYFGDFRWWNEPRNRAAADKFAGRIVTVSKISIPDTFKICRNTKPPGLAFERDSLMQQWTSLTAATNLAAHLVGPGGTIVWLGADGKYAANGRTHHHEPHRWHSKPKCYDKQLTDLVTVPPSLQAMQITAFNASPGTAWHSLLPVVRLDEILQRRAA
jgi:hypothetical protein